MFLFWWIAFENLTCFGDDSLDFLTKDAGYIVMLVLTWPGSFADMLFSSSDFMFLERRVKFVM